MEKESKNTERNEDSPVNKVVSISKIDIVFSLRMINEKA